MDMVVDASAFVIYAVKSVSRELSGNSCVCFGTYQAAVGHDVC